MGSSWKACKIVGTGRIRAQVFPGPKRALSFDEAEPTLTLEAAEAEAKRCAASHPCHYCEVCQLMCPDLCITRNDSGDIVIDLDFCKGCGLCAHYCPKGAIQMVLDE